MSDNNTSSGGAGFTSLLLIAFIVLKLTGVITWSWWWVLSPAWIGVGLLLLILGGVGLYYWVKSRNIDKKVINRQGELKSKWQQRLEEVQAAQKKANTLRNQKALDEKMTKNKGDEFRANNIV